MSETTEIIPVTAVGVVDTAIAPIVRLVAQLDGGVDTFDVLPNAMGLIEEVIRRCRELKSEVERHAVGYISIHGEQHIGPVRYYVGVTKTYKPRTLVEAVEAILDASGGDMARFTDCLSSNALKAGATRKMFADAGCPERFDAVFEASEEQELREGKVKQPTLQKFDPTFVR